MNKEKKSRFGFDDSDTNFLISIIFLLIIVLLAIFKFKKQVVKGIQYFGFKL
jgi:hypothetical protein